MRLELNGKLLSERPDEQSIALALGQMAGDDDVLSLHRPPADFMQAMGSATKGFVLNAYDDTQGTNLVSGKRRLDMATTAAMLGRFAEGRDWQAALRGEPGEASGKGRVSWQSGAERQRKAEGLMNKPGMAGLIAFSIFAVPFLGVMGVSKLLSSAAPVTWGDLLAGTLAIAGLSLYIGWLDVFFRGLRPGLAEGLGDRLGVKIKESFDYWDAGSWVARGGTRVNRVLVLFLDLFILLAGTMLPFAMIALVLFAIFMN
jgi:hypothetical protein